MLSCDSCRDQLITVGPVRGDVIIKVYRVLLKQCYDASSHIGVFVFAYFLTPKFKCQFIFNIDACIIERI